MPPITSVWWAANNCKAWHVSSTFHNFRRRVDPYMDKLAEEKLGKEGEAGGKALLELAQKEHNLPTAEVDFFGEEFDNLILFVARGGRRQINNKGELWTSMVEAFPDAKILQVEFSADIDYVVQCSLWRRARLVIGIHGGNLGCSMFLSPGQGLVEAGFGCKSARKEISMFGAAAVHNGAMYRCAQTTGNMETGGDVDVDKAVRDLLEMWGTEKVEELSTWPD